MTPAHWRDLGRMSYRDALEIQLATHEGVMQGGPDTLLLVEHEPVFTKGAATQTENLLLSPAEYEARGFQLETTDRGGDVTYHGPGQLTLYPIFDLNRHGRDLHRWLRDLEEVPISVLAAFGIEGRRFPPHTGAWVGDEKIAAIGVKVKRWVNLHGIGFNINLNLEPFRHIVPCGIQHYGVSSLSRSVGREVSMEEAKELCLDAFASVFKLEWIPKPEGDRAE